jgi:GAF domain-containing protein
VRIPVGKGICGSAVAKSRNVIVEDVRRESNYLACSVQTRSEIVVLIKDGQKILGELDIDSDEPAAFDAEDDAALESVADTIVRRLREIRHAPRRQGRKT